MSDHEPAIEVTPESPPAHPDSFELAPAASEVLATIVRRFVKQEVYLHDLFETRQQLKTLNNRTLMLIIELETWVAEEELPVEQALQRLGRQNISEQDRVRIFDALLCLLHESPKAVELIQQAAVALGVLPEYRDNSLRKLDPDEQHNLLQRALKRVRGTKRKENPIQSLARRYPEKLRALVKMPEFSDPAHLEELRTSLVKAQGEIVSDIYSHYGSPAVLRELVEVAQKFRRFAEELVQKEDGAETHDGVRREVRLSDILERLDQQESDFANDLERFIDNCLEIVETRMEAKDDSSEGKKARPPLRTRDWHNAALWEEFFRAEVEPLLKKRFQELKYEYNDKSYRLKQDLERFIQEQPERINKWDTALNDFEREMRNEIRRVEDASRKTIMYEVLGDFKDVVRSMGREGKVPMSSFNAPKVFPGVTPAVFEGILKKPSSLYSIRSTMYRSALTVNFLIIITIAALYATLGRSPFEAAVGYLGQWGMLGQAALPVGLAVILGATVYLVFLFNPKKEKRRLRNQILRDLRKSLRKIMDPEVTHHNDIVAFYKRAFKEANSTFYSPLLDLVTFIEGCLSRQAMGLRLALDRVKQDFVAVLDEE